LLFNAVIKSANELITVFIFSIDWGVLISKADNA